MMGHREKLRTPDERQALTAARELRRWHPGERKRIKRRVHKRVRQRVRQELKMLV